jgi:hypothetical protein
MAVDYLLFLQEQIKDMIIIVQGGQNKCKDCKERRRNM